MDFRILRFAPIVVLAAFQSLSAAVVPSFQGLGDLPGGLTASDAYGVSADGAFVVGRSESLIGASSSNEAFRWSIGGGLMGLGSPGSTAQAASANGDVIVGQVGSEAFRWTAGSGIVGLGDLPGGRFESFARDTSADGSVVVGAGASPANSVGQTEAYRWTQAGGMVGLGDLPGGNFDSDATGVSSDGSTIVGIGATAGGTEAFRWTAGAGMVGLGDLPGGSSNSAATGISANGDVIVGFAGSFLSPAMDAFRWTASEGMLSLGSLGTGVLHISQPFAASADGSSIVGYSYVDSTLGVEPFLWTPDKGMRSLADILTNDFNLDLTGWDLLIGYDISDDGTTIVGTGRNPNGELEGWIATIPEPTTGALVLLVSGLFMRRHTRS